MYYREDFYKPARQGVVLIAILLLHLLVVGALWSGLGFSSVRPGLTALTIEVLPTEKARPPPPRLSRVHLTESWAIQGVAPEVDFPVVEDLPLQVSDAPLERDVAADPVPSAIPAVPSVPNEKPRPLHVPGGQDRYPADSRRARESGEPTIRICVSATGTVDSVQVYASSGFPRLDQAAVSIGKEAIFKPAKLDGKPVPFCLPYRIKFKFANS
jgi:protein TonB